MMKMVKVARVGSKVVEVAIPSGATIAQALAAAGITMMPNEDVYENHVLRNSGTNVLDGATVIVEPRKITPLSAEMKDFLDYLQEEDLIDSQYLSEDEDDDELDYSSMYISNKEFVDTLISMAKEV